MQAGCQAQTPGPGPHHGLKTIHLEHGRILEIAGEFLQVIHGVAQREKRPPAETAMVTAQKVSFGFSNKPLLTLTCSLHLCSLRPRSSIANADLLQGCFNDCGKTLSKCKYGKKKGSISAIEKQDTCIPVDEADVKLRVATG